MKIMINNRHWDIELVSQNNKQLDNAYGITLYRESKILIDKTLGQDLMRDTILHELSHAYIFVYGLNQITKYSEENIADMFGAFSFDLVRNGKRIFEEFNI